MDQKLAKAVATYLATGLRPFSEDPNISVRHEGNSYFWHGASSTQENACSVLWRLGIATAAIVHVKGQELWGLSFVNFVKLVDEGKLKRSFPAYFSIPDTAEFEEILRRAPKGHWPTTNEVVSAYTDYAVEFDSDKLPVPKDREFELLSNRHLEFIKAVERQGFVQATPKGYRWTEKMEQVLQSLFLR